MDLVQQAITDVLDQRRAWPEGIPLFNLLYGVMRSRTSNFVASQQPVGSASEGPRSVALQEHQPLPAKAFFRSGEWTDLGEAVLRLVEDDPLLEQMVALMMKDPQLKAADFASMLGVSARDIYNAMKRLKRRAAPLQM